MEGNAEEIQKQIEQRINELPADVQNAILASDFNQKIQTIGNASGLHLDQIQELSDNTMLVMLGFMNEQEFKNELRQLLQSNPEAMLKIEADINSQIFLSIRESMKKFTEGQAKPAPAAPAPIPAAPASTPAPLPVVQASAPLPVVQTTTPATVEAHPADVMLTEKTVTVAPSATPPTPQDYKADPYREPTI